MAPQKDPHIEDSHIADPMGLPFEPHPEGIRFHLRLTPKAAQNRIQGVVQDHHGQSLVKIAVTAVPENGKANTALLKFLAKEWKIPKTMLSIESGATDRRKTLLIRGAQKALAQFLSEWVKAL